MQTISRRREDMEERRILSAALALSYGNFARFSGAEFPHYSAEIVAYTERFNRLNTEVHSRYALSCSCLFFAILGSPFSILQSRRQFLTSFILCFGPIVLGYYPLIMLCMNLCKSNAAFPPVLVMWVGNLLLFGAGGIVLRKVLR